VIRLALRVQRADAELVLAELLELAPSGVEEVEVGEDVLEYAVYGAPGELPELPDLRAAAGGALVQITTSELPDDWSERWKQFHRPVLIEPPAAGLPALYIRPPWESPSGRADVREIVIDPAQAFGTGAHATTRLCLELLLELAADVPRRGSLLDVGTGSGVLAIAAAHLGFAPVLGLDNDPEAVRAAALNADVNGVAVDVSRFDLRSQPLPCVEDVQAGTTRLGAAVLLANLLRPLLLELAHALPAAPAQLIAGGLLVGEVDEVCSAFCGRLGMHERGRRREGEWAALWLAADPDPDPDSGGAGG
jgi:ribosomal protein L11 methyltransferase